MAPSVFRQFRPAPLSSSFFLTSILGLLVTLFYFDELTATKFGKSITVACIIVFIAMFAAALISMRRAPAGAQFALDHHVSRSGKRPVRGRTRRPARKAKSTGKAKSRKPAKKAKRRPARKVAKKSKQKHARKTKKRSRR